MSNSYDISLKEALSFDVEIVKVITEDLVNFFLNQNDIKLDLIFMEKNTDDELKIIKPDNCAGFIENNYDAGGYIYYHFEGTEFTNYPAYCFAISFVRIDKTNISFIVQLSLLITISQLADCDVIIDAYGTFKDTDPKTDEVKIDNLLKLAVKDDYPFNIAIEKFYKNIYINGKLL